MAAGVAAVMWAGATMLYARAGARVGPLVLNLVKGVIACCLFGVTLVLLGRPVLGPLLAHPWEAAALAASGVIGISAGDTAYFAALRHIGPRQTSLLSLLAVPATAAGGLLFLGERLPPLGWLGIAVTLGGVAWVVSERRRGPMPEPAGDAATPIAVVEGSARRGVVLGIVAAACTAGGQLVNRGVIRDGRFDPLWGAAWRLLSAVVVLALLLPLLRARRRPRPAATGRGGFWRYLIPAMLLGTYGGIWLQQVAMTHAEAGYAQTLLTTSPIWILPMVALAGERVTARAVLGSVVALGGVALLVLSSR